MKQFIAKSHVQQILLYLSNFAVVTPQISFKMLFNSRKYLAVILKAILKIGQKPCMKTNMNKYEIAKMR